MCFIKKLPLLVFLIALSISCSKEVFDEESGSFELNLVSPQTKPIEVEVLKLINDHRLSLGLNTLSNMAVIKSVAFTHTDYMVTNNVVSHANFQKRSDYLIANAGAIKVSENVAYDFNRAETVVTAWLNSNEHRVIIEGDFTDFDLAAEQNALGEWYFTNIFIKK